MNYSRKKKYTATDEREWVSAEKKIYQRKKKYTAFAQKEWVSGNVIFSREIKIYDTFAQPILHNSFIFPNYSIF